MNIFKHFSRPLIAGIAALFLIPVSYAVATQVVQDNLTVDGVAQLLDHIHTGLGDLPVVTGTGTPTIATGSSDTAGEVTSGTSGTSVVITFAKPFAAAPFCVVKPQLQIASFTYTISTTAITITQTATTGEVSDYICIGVGVT